MTWANEHPSAVEDIEANLRLLSSNLSDELAEHCTLVCDECWDALEEYANDRFKWPNYKVGIGPEARQLVKGVLDSPHYKAKELENLYNNGYDFELVGLEEDLSMQFIGMIVLKNGKEDADWPVVELPDVPAQT